MRPSDLIARHKQIHQTSCSASGMELVLKCHGRLPSDDESLQKKYGGANIGFGEVHELADRGLPASNQTKPIAEALIAVQAETRAGRYPLVSLPVGLKQPTATAPGEVYFHIHVAEDSTAGLRIVDPATGKVVEGDLAQLETRIKGVLLQAANAGCLLPETVNFLTYTVATP